MSAVRAHGPEPLPEDVPELLAPFVRAIGVDKTVELLLAFGGAEIYLAKDPRGAAQLSRSIGAACVKAIGRELGFGQRLRVPLAKPWLARQLRLRQNLSAAAIARKLHIADTTARGYLKPLRDADQLALL